MGARSLADSATDAPDLRDDLVELTKPGITLMVIVTAGIGYLLASPGAPAVLPLLWALAGTGLVSAGGSALNHFLERDSDSRMRRTAGRPLPAGRMRPDTVLLFGVALSIAGLALLVWKTNLLTAALGASAIGLYIFVYTPLKRSTSLATLVGAVPGAVPPMMGWAAVTDGLEPGSWALFGLLFFWQLPHFLAIAWLCRDDYEAAGFPMLSVDDPDGRRTGRQAVLYCAALIPTSLLPSVLGLAGSLYFGGALVLGLAFLVVATQFAREVSRQSARRLMLYSILYLPLVLTVLVIDRLWA